MPEHDGADHLLTEKGPGKIPVWAYGVGIAGVVVAWQLFKGSSGTSASATSPQDSSGQQGTGQGDATTVTTVTRSGGRGWRPPWKGWGPGAGGISAPSSNEQWEAVAADWLIGLGNQPGEVHDALTDYLDGESQSGHRDAHERALVRLATNQWGAPPEPPGTPVGNPGWAPQSRGRLLGPGSPGGDIPVGSDVPPGEVASTGGTNMTGEGGGGSGSGATKDTTNLHETIKVEDRRRRR